MNNQNFQQFKQDFKRDVLIKIVIDRKYGRINRMSSKDVAKNILNLFSEEDPKKVFQQINKLSETHPEILDIFIKRVGEYDERFKSEQIKQIIEYLATKREEAN